MGELNADRMEKMIFNQYVYLALSGNWYKIVAVELH